MVLIVWACETGKNQAQEIRTTIHDVLNSTRDEQIKNEVTKVQFNLYSIFLCVFVYFSNMLYVNKVFLYIKLICVCSYVFHSCI